MKSFVSTILLLAGAGAVAAQQAQSPAEAPRTHEAKARVVAELASTAMNNAVKGVPLSAEEVNESVQTLADGNRIVRSSTGKFYRNSDGRVRRETSGGTGGMLGTTFAFGQGVSIVSPTDGQKFLLDTELKTAKILELNRDQKGIAIAGQNLDTAEARGRLEKVAEEMRAVVTTGRAGEPVRMAEGGTIIAPSGGFAYTIGQASKYETRTENLGTRDFEGVLAEGTRRTTTIPAGAIGNERPIETVYERWYSKELGLVVYSRNSDPRFGEQTYKLTNVVRAEPDPSLFSIPTHYKKFSEPGVLYRVDAGPKTSKAPASTVKPVTVAMPAKAARP